MTYKELKAAPLERLLDLATGPRTMNRVKARAALAALYRDLPLLQPVDISDAVFERATRVLDQIKELPL